MKRVSITGFRRGDGLVGIRNHLAVIPVSVCGAVAAERIARDVAGAVALVHSNGCCQIADDHEQTVRTLCGMASHPNAGAVLVVGLGCEGVRMDVVADAARQAGRAVETVCIQDSGGIGRAVAEGKKKLRKLAVVASRSRRTPCLLSGIILGLECGGSDATSGMVANPVIGVASDLLVGAGGTSILSETTEMIGAEHILARRTASAVLGRRLKAMVARTEERARASGGDLRQGQPTPGNRTGGITTIEEKSLGCMYKAGGAVIREVLEYAERPRRRGLCFMDTPGQDVESMSGMAAAGAQIMVFSTGRGTPTGCALAPVIKVTANADTAKRMRDTVDMDASVVLDGAVSVRKAGGCLFDLIVDVCNGRRTRSEINGHQEFAIFRVGYTY